jgi:putative membrane protein
MLKDLIGDVAYAYAAYAALFVMGVFATWLGNRFTTYELGDFDITMHKGMLAREEKVIPFEKVDNISIRRSAPDMVLGLGNVYIDTPAGPDYEMAMKGLSNGDVDSVMAILREDAMRRQETRERAAGERIAKKAV